MCLVVEVNFKEKVKGALFGLCVGDAIGELIDGGDRKAASKFVNKTLLTRNFEIKKLHETARILRGFDFGYGQITDDSQLAIELVKSFVDCGNSFVVEHYASRIAHLFKSGRVFGPGFSSAKAAAKLNRGIPWTESGCVNGSCGNSPALRGSALGFLLVNDHNENFIVKCAAEQSIITHKDPRCQAGSAAMAFAVRECILNPNFNEHEFLWKIATICKPISQSTSESILSIESLLKCPFDVVHEKLKSIGSDYSDGTGDGISPFVTSSICFSIWCFLSNRNNFLKAISTAISGGGDCDSIGALTGVLSGSQLGYSSIPFQLIDCLRDKNTLISSDLLSLIDKYYS